MNTKLIVRKEKDSWRPLSGVMVGKDILELLSSSMYVDPMTIYREYIQNAADAIDEALDQGLLDRSSHPGLVNISIDVAKRTVLIRDNGIGVRKQNFESQLGTFGGSLKRGAAGRGFRGVGRLSGLGYCQKLTFRTLAAGDHHVSEMVWDCRLIKKLLNTTDKHWSLEDLLREVVSIRLLPSEKDAKSFFEVEMNGVIRHKNDVLLNRETIYHYLSEVAPVPFHPDFSFGSQITEMLGEKVALGNLNIHVEGKDEPIYRPYRDSIEVDGEPYDRFTDVKTYTLPSVDDDTSAIAWIMDHGYKGAVPDKRIAGLRLRCGNIQIGGNDLLADVFKETRFNSWSVGEIHILDGRITPNGRRDYFEQGVHLDNLLNHITPHTREITARCRESSRLRNRLRDFSRFEATAIGKLAIIEQGQIGKKVRNACVSETEKLILMMEQCLRLEAFDASIDGSLTARIRDLDAKLKRMRDFNPSNATLLRSSKSKQAAYEEVFGLIYECSENQESARKLVGRIIDRLKRA
jgi:molecular chaperone HtpG